MTKTDKINPAYYNGTDCIEVMEVYPVNIAMAIKYAWRAGEKDPLIQDLEKCLWYVKRAIERAENYRVAITDPDVVIANRKLHARHPVFLQGKSSFPDQARVLECLVTVTPDTAIIRLERVIRELKSAQLDIYEVPVTYNGGL